MNFFAGPQDKQFSAPINFYDVHYAFTHYVGTSGKYGRHARGGQTD